MNRPGIPLNGKKVVLLQINVVLSIEMSNCNASSITWIVPSLVGLEILAVEDCVLFKLHFVKTGSWKTEIGSH